PPRSATSIGISTSWIRPPRPSPGAAGLAPDRGPPAPAAADRSSRGSVGRAAHAAGAVAVGGWQSGGSVKSGGILPAGSLLRPQGRAKDEKLRYISRTRKK